MVDNKSILPEYVYFIQPENQPYVKIGKSADPFRRLHDLQAGNPFPLKLLFYNKQLNESKVLLKFHKYQIHGEWFHLSKEIIEFIQRYNSDIDFNDLIENTNFSSTQTILIRVNVKNYDMNTLTPKVEYIKKLYEKARFNEIRKVQEKMLSIKPTWRN